MPKLTKAVIIRFVIAVVVAIVLGVILTNVLGVGQWVMGLLIGLAVVVALWPEPKG